MAMAMEAAPVHDGVRSLIEEKERESRTRRLTGPMGRLLSVVLVCFSLFQLYATVSGTLDAMTLRSVHILFLLSCAFLPFFRMRHFAPSDHFFLV